MYGGRLSLGGHQLQARGAQHDTQHHRQTGASTLYTVHYGTQALIWCQLQSITLTCLFF